AVNEAGARRQGVPGHSAWGAELVLTPQGTDGKGTSGDEVPTRIMSRPAAVIPAASSAPRAARVAISKVVVPGSAMCRLWMPVRSVIHLSEVSIIFSRSKFVMIFSGA